MGKVVVNGTDDNHAVGRQYVRALEGLAPADASVLLLGFEDLQDDQWAVLYDAGVGLRRVADVDGALQALAEHAAPVVITDSRWAGPVTAAIRHRSHLASVHIVVGAPLDSASDVREAFDAGADDVMRMPFEPALLAARVGAGLRAARLRANEALLQSLVSNIPGALYRCACDSDWTMEWLSPEIEGISGYPASDFIRNSTRTFASVIHRDDRDEVERLVHEGVTAGRPFTLEYRIQRADGDVRWVLERGQGQEAGDGRFWLDGAIFDITVRKAAEQALREREVLDAQLAEVAASRARILEAADRARREIERNLHDGAQQRFVSLTLQLQRCLSAHPELSAEARSKLEGVLTELGAGLGELRDLAHGLHPAVLTDRGLEHALTQLAHHASVPVDLRVALPSERLGEQVQAAAYFTVSEGLTNVAKYARATNAWVDVHPSDRNLSVEIGDDGAGGAGVLPGSGLEGVRDRIEALNGTLECDSRLGEGTVLRVQLPIA